MLMVEAPITNPVHSEALSLLQCPGFEPLRS